MGHLHSLNRPSQLTAAAWAAACSLAFIVVYGGCTWLTLQRGDVGQWYWDWELKIPFLPWMIVPYWSIDLLFVAAFFVCRTRQELTAHGRRVLLAIAVAGLGFLLLPLRAAFPRPDVTGMFGWMFGALRAFDAPHNLFPSLHIAFGVLLWTLYARRFSGWWVHPWFVLVTTSTLFTWQHHIGDIAGGLVLATFCFYAGRETAARLPVTPNYRVGGYYLAGALACGVVATWWLLWPMMSLLLIAGAYCGLGPGVYRKENGVLPWSARLVLAPVLIGQRISLWFYQRQCRAWDEVVPGVLMGRVLRDTEAAAANATAVLDLTAEFSEARSFRAARYLNVPVLDLTEPTDKQLQQAADFIREQTRQGRVYVHCKIGYSRSAAAVGAFILRAGHAATSDQVVEQLRRARPSIVIRPEVSRVFARLAGNRTEET